MVIVNTVKEIVEIENSVIAEFNNRFFLYIEKFRKYGITMKISPCYCYGGKHHTEHRATGCFMSFKILLFPREMTYNKALKTFNAKKLFSTKVLTIKKIEDCYHIKRIAKSERILKRILDRYLRKAEKFFNSTKNPINAIRENFFDVIISWILLDRYFNEVKMTYRGTSLIWFFVLMIVISQILEFFSEKIRWDNFWSDIDEVLSQVSSVSYNFFRK